MEHQVGDWARLVVSELVGNVVLHGDSSPAHLCIARRPGEVIVLVINEGPGVGRELTDERADAYCEEGRGLMIVAALSTRVGIKRQGSMNLVWAGLRLAYAEKSDGVPTLDLGCPLHIHRGLVTRHRGRRPATRCRPVWRA